MKNGELWPTDHKTLKLENHSKKQIEEAIRAISQKPSSLRGSVFIPEGRYEATVNKLYGAKTGQERTVILQNAMEYSPSTPPQNQPK